MDEGTSLCVIGVAQHTTRATPAPEPLESWVAVARAAAADAGAPAALSALDSLQIVYCQSWQYDSPVGRLAKCLGAAPRHQVYSGIGGTTPQDLIASTATAMGRGELDLALVVSAEALATRRAAKRSGDRLTWSHGEKERSPYPLGPLHRTVQNHKVFQAWETFPLWDTARRAARGESLDDYARRTAEMMAGLTHTAAQNPHAWRPEVLQPQQIGTVSDQNRYVGWPYTKREVAVMDVDMAAALLLATDERADALGVPASQRVYLASSAHAEDPAPIAARPDPGASPALTHAVDAALYAAELGRDELRCFDLYSCFPSSLHLACDALGLNPMDSRGLTVTGGLPYAGGPASAYLMHAIASVVDALRRAEGAALVTGVGMNLQKHVAAVYSTTPGTSPPPARPAPVGVPVIDCVEGRGVVAAYTVAHGRDGQAVEGLAILDTTQGRTLARVHQPDLLDDAESRELVGQNVTLTTNGSRNEARW